MRDAKEQLIKNLNEIHVLYSGDAEYAHLSADKELLEFIDDQDVNEAYNKIKNLCYLP